MRVNRRAFSIRGKVPSFNAPVVDCTAAEKSEWNLPPLEAGTSRFSLYVTHVEQIKFSLLSEQQVKGAETVIVSLEEVNKIYNGNVLFEHINAKIEDADRIGLIGPNGAGKTTLLRLICREESADNGIIAVSNRKTIGILHQNSGLSKSSTIIDEMKSVFQSLLDIHQRIKEIESLFAANTIAHDSAEYQALSTEYSEKSAFFEQKDGYLIDVKIKTVLNGMGFGDKSMDTVISTLSGGEKTRLAMAKLLLEQPDLLILDEPTNHLDFKTLAWLEDYLSGYKGALLIVSHDRYFLDRCTDKTWEIENHRLHSYKGSYSKFVVIKQANYERQLKEYEEQQREIAKMQEFIDKNIVRASTTKSAQSRRAALERMEIIEKPYVYHKTPIIHFNYTQEPVKDVLCVTDMDLSVGSGETYQELAHGITLQVERGDKLAVIGTNGIGKSTFLKAIQNKIPYRRGRVVWGGNVKRSFFEQETAMLNPENTVLEELWQRYPSMNETAVRSALGSVLLTGENVYKKVGVVSGGERVKLSLAILMLEHPNVLIMDEPTNHLDIYTKEVLEKALTEYTGTLILVSHDRYLLNKIPTRIMDMKPDSIRFFKGRFDEYTEFQKMQDAECSVVSSKSSEPEKTPKGNYRSKQQRSEEAKMRQRVKELERFIESSEQEIAALEQEMTLPEVYQDYQTMNEKCAALEEKKQLHAQCLEEWAELAECLL